MRTTSSRITSVLRTGVAATLLMGMASIAAQAQRPHVGVRFGVDFDSNDALVSTQATIPVSTRLDFYPSIDVYLPDQGTRTGFNGDLRYRLPIQQGPDIYVGGGLNVLMRSVNNQSDTDLGVKGLFGIESRGGWVHPFLEGRILQHDNTHVQFVGGLNFTIGGR